MPIVFNARDAGNYERLMGRWSRRLAPLFIEHAGIADGEEVLEVGCGTGSLTFALAEAARFARLTAVDQSAVYLAAAQAKNRDRKIGLERGDGCALRFADASFDRALSMLVLPSVVPEPEQMVAEMRRVTRPGGVVAAAFWDTPGGTPHQRMFWDTAWEPFESGEGGPGAYVAALDDAQRNRLERHLRAAYLAGRPDGERSFVAVALSCRGVVPRT